MKVREAMNILNIPTIEPQRQEYFISILGDEVHTRTVETGYRPTYHIITFGCQMNARDSEKLGGILTDIGYEETDREDADIVLFNTCTVRENANDKLYGRLGQIKKFKEKNPKMIIAICGCMMQEEEEVARIKKSYRYVDIVFGTHNIYKLAEILYNRFTSEHQVIDVIKDTNLIVEKLPNKRYYSFKSGVNIMFGCNNFCTFCIVPYVRGRERSRNPEDIVAEIKDLVADGVLEVMLLGQNVNSYGKSLEDKTTFAKLLEKIVEIPGLERVRFMTPHPKDLSDDVLEVMQKHEKICRHIHLPLQSGSTQILKKMNRRYSKEQYLELAQKIKEKLPEISLTTDIIVGFPGETEEDFLDTLDVVRKVQYDSAFTFIYSKRSGTPAAKMENQIDEKVVKDRFDRLLKEVQKSSRVNSRRLEGKIEKVLIESENTHLQGYVTGRLSNNTIVHLKGGKRLIGHIVEVKLEKSKGFYYMGHMVGMDT